MLAVIILTTTLQKRDLFQNKEQNAYLLDDCIYDNRAPSKSKYFRGLAGYTSSRLQNYDIYHSDLNWTTIHEYVVPISFENGCIVRRSVV